MSFISLVKSVINSIVKLSRPLFSLEGNMLKFKINSEFFYRYELKDFETKTRHDSYVLEAYTLKSKNLFIEYVQTDTDVVWRGLASSFFIELLKSKLHFKSMIVLENLEFNGYEFITYKIDDHFILNFIYIYEINKEVFILDINSKLYTSLLRNFQKDYQYTYSKNEDDIVDFNFSIVRENNMNNYFSYEGSEN
jgi:hypothetical protein